MSGAYIDDIIAAEADRAARLWQGETGGPVRVGSDAHKRLFCRMLLDTHNPYKPAVIDWPKLADDVRARLIALPIWDIAVQTEGKAKIRVATYAERVADPLLRQAIELDGFEEGRPSRCSPTWSPPMASSSPRSRPISSRATPNGPSWSRATANASTASSPSASSSSPSARASSRASSSNFEPVMQEECRHILFFVNWAAWHRKNLPWWRKPIFDLRRVAVFARLIQERMDTADDMGGDNFTMTGHKSMGIDIDAKELMNVCLAENDRRMGGYDERLLRPKLVPRLVRMARRFMRGRRKS